MSSILRSLALVLSLALMALPGPASALSIFDPFNLPGAADGGVVKLGNGVRYAEGARGLLDVYAPENPTGNAPVVLFIYGGSWRAGDRGEYEFAGRAIAARGFVTVIADYRVFPEARYPVFIEDAAAAIKWIEDNIVRFGGDPQKLFVAGHSAGAYNAVMLGLDPYYLTERGVTIPIRAVAGLAGPYDFYPFEYGEVTDAFGEAANPEGTQPVNLVTSASPPMFLATGAGDPIVRPRNTQTLAARLRATGAWVTEKYYEGIGHMEAVTSLGAMMRFRAPILDDMVFFFQQFGAFPSGVPRAAAVPEAAQPLSPDGMLSLGAKLDEGVKPLAD
jgi:acetyl esterase/lipase